MFAKVLNTLILILIGLNLISWLDIYDSFKLESELVIYFLDVGQGDAILIKTPLGHYGLIDAGKGSTVLSEMTKHMPLFSKNIDFVVLTHPDADHIEGMIEVLKRFNVQNVFMSQTTKESEILNEIKTTIRQKGINSYYLNQTNDFSFDDINFDTIWPADDVSTESNDQSVGFVISYKNFTFYTAGDLAQDLELKSLNYTFTKDIDVLKVSHHGSEYSTGTDFLELTSPEVSLISVGENSYGHPSQNVLSNLVKVNSDVWRTDTQGTITLKTNGEKYCLKAKIYAKCY